ncbi:MAG: hypothetical protein JNJ54_23190 [Myxococcaceae bacterium]|nr:hypothetical protein [Myxococcaceae bacterium]
MRASVTLWLVVLAPTQAASAGQGSDGFGWVACRHDGVLDVSSWINQDEGGTKWASSRFALTPSQQRARADGGPRWPLRQENESLAWEQDAGCGPLNPVPVDFDVRLVPSEPTSEELDAFERDGTRLLPLNEAWEQAYQVRLLRSLELRSKRGVVASRRLELNGSPVELDAFDVGDGRHALVVARWIFTHHEGAPVRDLDFLLLPVSGPRRTLDAGLTRELGVPEAEFGWAELARRTRAVAKALERRRSVRAPEFRALASRRERQLTLARTPAFQGAEKACLAAANDLEGGRSRWEALRAAVTALRTSTAPADWPLVVDRLRWEGTSCGDVVADQMDGGVAR